MSTCAHRSPGVTRASWRTAPATALSERPARSLSEDATSAFVLPAHRLVFCAIAKAGSTAWLRFLRRLSGDAEWLGSPHFVSEQGRVANLTQIRHFTHRQEREAMLVSPDWVRVVVVRDPAERLLSAYLDKVRKHKDSTFQLHRYARNLRLGDGAPVEQQLGNLSFAEFVDRVTRNLDLRIRLDEHWAPQSSSCGLSDLVSRYHVIVHDRQHPQQRQLACVMALMEGRGRWSLSRASARDLQNTFGSPTRARRAEHATDASAKLRAFYDTALLRRVVAAYAKDYAVFGLTTPTV